MITQIIGFIVLVVIFKKLFDMVDQIRDNHRKKHEVLEKELELVRAKRALLVRLAWERHQARKDRHCYYVDDMGSVPMSFDISGYKQGKITTLPPTAGNHHHENC